MESNLYQRLKRATPGFSWQRHEDKLTKGIPDTSYSFKGISGWVELKTYDRWPKDGYLKWDDLKPEQVNWLSMTGRNCGHCYILLEVGKNPKTSSWLLINYTHVRNIREYSKEELLEAACIHGNGPISKNIVGVLCNLKYIEPSLLE